MPSKNLGEIFADQGPLLHTELTLDDLFYVWRPSGSGVSRSRALDEKNLILLTNQGIDVQRGSAKPTLRSGGDALVAGDRWWDTVENRWWFWSGVYWLTEEILFLNIFADTILSASFTPGGIPIDPTGNDLFLVNFSGSIQPAAGTYDGSNNWSFSVRRDDASNAAAAIGSSFTLNSGAGGSGVRTNFSIALGIHLDVSALNVQHLRITWNRSGTPGNLNPTSCTRISYRLAKP